MNKPDSLKVGKGGSKTILSESIPIYHKNWKFYQWEHVVFYILLGQGYLLRSVKKIEGLFVFVEAG